MIAGQEVILVAFGDQRISRVLVAVENAYLFVCRREEFEAATRENREPVCIGFRAEYLLEAARMAA